MYLSSFIIVLRLIVRLLSWVVVGRVDYLVGGGVVVLRGREGRGLVVEGVLGRRRVVVEFLA